MALEMEIKKKFPGFALEVQLHSDHNCMGILGASGCGKTMTLKAIAGILKPDEGRIVLDGEVFFDSKKKINLTPQERRIGYLFQNYALFPTMTVEENLACVLKGNKAEIQQQVQKQLERYQLKGLEKQLPSQLSGGQQQRVALARMLLTNPRMILLDEPFSALDGFLKDMVQEEVKELLDDFSGEVLMVTHSRDEVYKMCDRVTILNQGRTMLTGDTKEVFANPEYMEVARLTGCKNISPIERINDYEIYAEDWNLTFRLDEKVAEDIRYVGIRAHYLESVESSEGDNTFPMEVNRYVEAPFEHQYLMTCAGAKRPVWWLIPKGSLANPTGYLHFPQKALMLLK